MNKNLYPIFAIAGLATMASCSEEKELIGGEGNEVTVTLSAQLPNAMQSRAYSDGTTATNLQYAVFEVGGTTANPVISETNATINGSATVEVQLINGKEYEFIFWAQSPNATCYNVDLTGKTVTVDYTGAVANDETRDAFFKQEKFTVKGNMSKTIELRRPFAQINVGTNDLDVITNTGHDVKAEMVVRNVANTLDLSEGTVTGSEEVTFAKADIPTNQKFPVDNYSYLEMNYVLVDREKTTADIDLNFYLDEETTPVNTVTVTYAPLQRNYRTNIYGSLLTSNVLFNVEIKPEYYTPDYDLLVWEGDVVTPDVDASTKTISINTPAELAGLAAMVNADYTSVAGYTVTLENDIDLNNLPWTPIGMVFKGWENATFDGNGKTIYNLNVEDHEMGGLFGMMIATVKNLTIDGATIKTNHWGGVIAGYSTDHVGLNIENCNVKNATVVCETEYVSSRAAGWDNGDKAGAIIGYAVDGTITNCSVENVEITAYRDCGGIIGCADGTTITNCSVSGLILNQDNTHNYKGYTKESDYNFGEIIGRRMNNITESNNTSSDVVINYNQIVATPETFGSILSSLTSDATIQLSEGVFEFTNASFVEVKQTWTSWDNVIENEHEGVEAMVYGNLNENITITLIGAGKDKTALVMSDGLYNIPAGSINRSLMVNKANLKFSNMLHVRRYCTILDATTEEYENCEFWGNFQPRGETVSFKDCEFYTSARTSTISGLASMDGTSNQALFYGCYSRYLNFDNCKFSANQNKAVQLYATMRSNAIIDVTATNCTLYGGANVQNGKRGFFEIHNEHGLHGNLNLTNCSINSADAANWPGGVWIDGYNGINEQLDPTFNVTVDGEAVQTVSVSFSPVNAWTGNYTY